MICDDGHRTIWFEEPPCPLCEALRNLERCERAVERATSRAATLMQLVKILKKRLNEPVDEKREEAGLPGH